MHSDQIIIVDSGSTKTQWVILERGQVVQTIHSVGMNPYFITENEIAEIFKKEILPKINVTHCSSLFFYGAGCASDQGKASIRNVFSKILVKTEIHVETDLLGAARAVCNSQEGMAAILGTGSNSCYYDGNAIVESIPSLGYILGDEGSGAHLGKALITAILSLQAPEDIRNLFYEKTGLAKEKILTNIYKTSFPNRFLASFAIFIFDNRTNPFIETIINTCFESFFDKHICRYANAKTNEIGFVGSIAFYFREYLETIANAKGYRISTIQKSPIESLIEFHLNSNL